MSKKVLVRFLFEQLGESGLLVPVIRPPLIHTVSLDLAQGFTRPPG